MDYFDHHIQTIYTNIRKKSYLNCDKCNILDDHYSLLHTPCHCLDCSSQSDHTCMTNWYWFVEEAKNEYIFYLTANGYEEEIINKIKEYSFPY